jgi:ribonuclease R
MRELMHGDRVAVRIRGHDRRGRPEGSLVEVLERNTSSVVGKYLQERGVGFVAPENPRITHRIVVPTDAVASARPGQVVLAEITAQPTRQTQPIGRIAKVLGKPSAPGIEIEIAIHGHGLPTDWPVAVEKEVRRLGKEVPAEAKRGREDLRHLPLLTIDGADARDFDDAVFCEPTPAGWRLYVAIADAARRGGPGPWDVGLLHTPGSADAAGGALERALLAQPQGRSPLHGLRDAGGA